eukprot:jgi/Bigna1/75564/fgenesh1_pg.35_\
MAVNFRFAKTDVGVSGVMERARDQKGLEMARIDSKNKDKKQGSQIAKSDFDDMVFMPIFTGELAVQNVITRFKKKRIYTNVSSILISVIDFNPLMMMVQTNILHIYQKLFPKGEEKNQSILISGESGAGKTEATKLLLRYFALQSGIISGNQREERVSETIKHRCSQIGRSASLEQKIIQANPILEAFGNAKTTRNDNSSRFGRWLNIYFNRKGQIQMSSITNYLLEESRVTYQDKGERNFNIFYLACASWEKEDKVSREGKIKANTFSYLNKSGCFTVPGRDDYEMCKELKRCFREVGFSDDEQKTVFKVVEAVLNLGNIEFKAGPVVQGKSSSRITEESAHFATQAAECLGVNPDSMKRALVTEILSMSSGSMYLLPRDIKSAKGNRCIVHWYLIFASTLNMKRLDFEVGNYGGSFLDNEMKVIGICLGFTRFTSKQLCINLANEKLQQYFVRQVFKMELKLYQEEKIDVQSIPYPDNSDTLALLEMKNGVFPLLKDELKIKTGKYRSDENYAAKLQKLQAGHPKFTAPRMSGDVHFMIHHFSEPVKYSAKGFLEKNRSKLTSDVEDMLRSTKDPIVSSMITEEGTNVKRRRRSRAQPPASTGRNRRRKKGAQMSLAASFQTQLNSLMTTIKKTESHFIRCIKPNARKIPLTADQDEVMRQMSTCYTMRMSHWNFFKRSVIVAQSMASSKSDLYFGKKVRHKKEAQLKKDSNIFVKGIDFRAENLKICEKAEKQIPEYIKDTFKIKLWQSGTNLMFYKAEMEMKLEELLMDSWQGAAKRITSMVKMWLIRKNYLKMRDAYRTLVHTLEQPEVQLQTLEGCLHSCEKFSVPERFLTFAKKTVEALSSSKQTLRLAFETKSKSIPERLSLMHKAITMAALGENSRKSINILQDMIPLLERLHMLSPKFIEKIAEIKKCQLVAASARTSAVKVKNAVAAVQKMGMPGIPLLQDAITEADRIVKEAHFLSLRSEARELDQTVKDANGIMKVTTQQNKDSKVFKLNLYLQKGNTGPAKQSREGSSESRYEKARKGNQRSGAGRDLESTRQKEIEALVAERLRVIMEKEEKKRAIFAKELEEKYMRQIQEMKIELKHKGMNLAIKHRKQRDDIAQRYVEAKQTTRSIFYRYEDIFNPKTLQGSLKAAIIKHSECIEDPSVLISWYSSVVFKGLNAKPLSQSLQLLQIQTIIGRSEVQSAGVVPYLEKAIHFMTDGQNEEEDIDDMDGFAESMASILPPPPE